MSDFRTPISNKPADAPQDMQDGLNFSNVAPRAVPEAKNYATDEEVARRARSEIYPLVMQARSDRKAVERGWQELRNMELMQHDQNQKYKGRSNAYLPIHAKNLQTQVTSLTKALFPSDEYIDCVAQDVDKERALKAKQYMQYQFERVAYLRMYMKLFSRQLVNYGFSVLKFWYRKPAPYAKAKGRKLGMNDLQQMAYGPEFKSDSLNQGLAVSARNIFNFYAYPYTAETLRETILHFEDIRMSFAELTHVAKSEGWANPAALNAAPNPSALSSDEQEMFASHDVPSNTDQMGTKLGDVRVVTECFTFMELPASEYTDADAKGCPLPVRIIFIGEEPVYIQRNSSYHQSSPFLGLCINSSPGFLLGYSSGKMIAPLQYLANDFANQTNDVCIYGLNPGVKVIPGMLVGALRPMAPGVTMYVNDQSAIEFFHPPTEQVGVGMSMLQQMMTMAQDFGGAPPILQGTNAKGSGKTATGSQILQANAQGPLQDLAEDLETEVLVPLASRAWALAQQHAPEKMMIEVFGLMKEMTKDELLFDAKWRWLASSQAANAQTRAYQATNFIQMVMPMLPLLQQQGIQVDLLPMLRRVYSDALGFRGFDDVFKQGMPPMLAGQGAPGMGGVPGGMDQGAPPRSPAESANGGALPMQPGEGGAFDQVRDDADLMSALAGADQGGGTYEG